MTTSEGDDILFEVTTPLNVHVRTTRRYWTIIATVKHPVMSGRERDVQEALLNPEQVRMSRSDPQVLLFYRPNGDRRWICIVVKRLNEDGFIITAYRTGNILEGTTIWPR